MKTWLRAGSVCCGVLLGACSGGSGGDNGSDERSGSSAFCDAVGGGAATVTAAAEPGSTFEQAPAAFDGDLASAAVLSSTGSGGGTLCGTAQAGVTVAGGRVAGVLFSRVDTGTYTITINTYQDGTPVDSTTAGTQSFRDGMPMVQNCMPGATCIVRQDGWYVGIDTSAPINAIEAVIAVNGATAPLPIRELCVQ